MKNASNEWTDEDIETILTTLFLLVFVTIFVSFIILKFQGGGSGSNNTSSNRSTRSNTNAIANNRRRNANTTSEQQQYLNRLNENDDDDCWYKKYLNPVAHRLVDGILPFRFTSNSVLSRHNNTTTPTTSENSKNSDDEVLTMLASIFLHKQNDSSIIPSRGSNIVLSLDASSLSSSSLPLHNEKLTKMLTILGTTYNLFIIISLSSIAKITAITNNNNVKNTEEKVSYYREKLYQMMGRTCASNNIILPHRIIASTSLTGRVAFVRQLKPDTVIDFDSNMSEQLSRFGFRVVVIGNDFYLS